MKKVICVKLRKELPDQLKLGETYFLDTESAYIGVSGKKYAGIYREANKTGLVGYLDVSYFVDAEDAARNLGNSGFLKSVKNVVLSQTKYYAKYNTRILNVLLHKTKESCMFDIYVDGALIYNYNVTDIHMILKDDAELTREVFNSIFVDDKERWIDYAECHSLVQMRDNYVFCGRESLLDFRDSDITFHLKIKNTKGKGFRLEFTNDSNDDTMVCYCHANSVEEMQSRMQIYVGIVSSLACELNDNITDILGNTFTLER